MGTAASAGSAQSNLSVSANVSSTCTINSGSLAFGGYDPVAGTQVDGSATVSVACTKGASAQITLGQGTHAAGGSTDTAPSRRMSDGSNNLQYSLFSDASRSVTWGKHRRYQRRLQRTLECNVVADRLRTRRGGPGRPGR